MRHAFLVLSTLLMLVGCPKQQPVSPNPLPAPDTDLCGKMCEHLGPKGLNCPEGQDVYDSDKPGPHGVPNETCEQFCQYQQDNGAFVNPRCLIQVPRCADIETWRQKTCQ
jgi:hypothetical protein